MHSTGQAVSLAQQTSGSRFKLYDAKFRQNACGVTCCAGTTHSSAGPVSNTGQLQLGS